MPQREGSGGDDPQDTGNTANQERILLAKKQSIAVDRFMVKWTAGDLDIEELYRRTGKWFQDNNRRRIFLNIIDWADQYQDGYPDDDEESGRGILLNISPLTSKVFRRWFRRELYDDFAERLRDLHEAITMFAFLLGDEDVRSGKEAGLPSARETFRR